MLEICQKGYPESSWLKRLSDRNWERLWCWEMAWTNWIYWSVWQLLWERRCDDHQSWG